LRSLTHEFWPLGLIVAFIAATLTTAAVSEGLAGALMGITSINSTGTVKTVVHYVSGDKILDGNGTEVMWRGAGGSYLFHTGDYITAWELHFPEIQKMGLNTIRLAFRFPDSSPGLDGYIASDTLDYSKLDGVLAWLDQHNLKAILDCHNYRDMYGDFGSQKLVNDWVSLAQRYRGDPRIVAYELFNEPYYATWDPSVRTREDVTRAYQTLTKEIRKVDPGHIIIWQSRHYLPVLETVSQYFEPNIVFTVHRWCGEGDERFQIWSIENFSRVSVGYLVEMRQKLDIPFWFGEFGSFCPFNESNPEWLLAEQTLFRCEEQVIGWNLWMGRLAKYRPWSDYLSFFPLKVYNENLVRQAWFMPIPKLTDYIMAQQGVDMLELYQMGMWHNTDYVTFKPAGIIILVITNHALPDGTFETVSQEQITVTEELTFRNEEGTTTHPGDWNIKIFSLG